MIQSPRNALINASNGYQGDKPKALCVCSAGLLRSPTLAKVLSDKGWNTRACGEDERFALIPLSTALCVWADYIFAIGEAFYDVEWGEFKSKVVHFDVKDDYDAFDPELVIKFANLVKEVIADDSSTD